MILFMKKICLLLFIFLFLGCNNDTPKTIIHVIVINNVSYNLTEEAFDCLSSYLEYLEEYYSNEEKSEEIINVLSTKIAEKLSQKLNSEEDVVNQKELESIIEGIKQEGKIDGIPCPAVKVCHEGRAGGAESAVGKSTGHKTDNKQGEESGLICQKHRDR